MLMGEPAEAQPSCICIRESSWCDCQLDTSQRKKYASSCRFMHCRRAAMCSEDLGAMDQHVLGLGAIGELERGLDWLCRG